MVKESRVHSLTDPILNNIHRKMRKGEGKKKKKTIKEKKKGKKKKKKKEKQTFPFL